MSSHCAFHRSGALVMASPPAQFMRNRPSLKGFSPGSMADRSVAHLYYMTLTCAIAHENDSIREKSDASVAISLCRNGFGGAQLSLHPIGSIRQSSGPV